MGVTAAQAMAGVAAKGVVEMAQQWTQMPRLPAAAHQTMPLQQLMGTASHLSGKGMPLHREGGRVQNSATRPQTPLPKTVQWGNSARAGQNRGPTPATSCHVMSRASEWQFLIRRVSQNHKFAQLCHILPQILD